MFFCSTEAFAGILSNDYDEKNHHIKIRYNTQDKEDFLPHQDEIFFAIKNTVTKKNRNLNVHIEVVLWDCEEKTDNKYGLWKSLFYPTSKRQVHRNCQEQVNFIRDRARVSLSSSNESSAYLDEIKKARAKEKNNLRRHKADISSNLNMQKNLNKIKESMEALEDDEEIIQRLIIDMKNHIEKESNTNLSSFIRSFREQIGDDQRYNNSLIENFLKELENLYSSDTEKAQSLFFNLNSFLQQKQSLSQSISLPNNDIEKLKNMFDILNKFIHILDTILVLNLKSAVSLKLWLDRSPQNFIPSNYKKFLDRWLLVDITESDSLKRIRNQSLKMDNSTQLIKIFFTDIFSYSYNRGTLYMPTDEEERIKVAEKLSLTWAEIEQQIANHKLPPYITTYFKEQYKYNDPNSIEVFMQYEKIVSELLSFFEELLDTFSPTLLSDLEDFKENLLNDPVLFELTQDLTNQVELIIKNKKTLTNSIDEAKKIFSHLHNQVSENYKANAFYHILEFVKLIEDEIDKRLVILRNRKKDSEKQLSALDSMKRAGYDNLSQAWGVSVSDIKKLDLMYVDFSFDLVGSYISKSSSGGGGYSGYSSDSCYNCVLR